MSVTIANCAFVFCNKDKYSEEEIYQAAELIAHFKRDDRFSADLVRRSRMYIQNVKINKILEEIDKNDPTRQLEKKVDREVQRIESTTKSELDTTKQAVNNLSETLTTTTNELSSRLSQATTDLVNKVDANLSLTNNGIEEVKQSTSESLHNLDIKVAKCFDIDAFKSLSEMVNRSIADTEKQIKEMSDKLTKRCSDDDLAKKSLQQHADTLSSLDAQIKQLQKDLKQNSDNDDKVLERVYPVGAVYMSFNNVEPSVLFGFGSWERIEGRFLYCSNTSNERGGSVNHCHTTANCTLTLDQIPPHSHTWFQKQFADGGKCTPDSRFKQLLEVGSAPRSTETAGRGQPHNHGNTSVASNLPPYITCFCWHRIA